MKRRPAVRLKWILAALLLLGFGTWRLVRHLEAPTGVAIQEPRLNEASGLAASLHAPDLLWSLNDSRNEPVLFAFTTAGQAAGTVRIRGVENVDWEGLASFELDGARWLAIGDIGDNSARRDVKTIHVVAEPPPSHLSPGREISVDVAWTIHFRIDEGARDCEALFVDTAARQMAVISKRHAPPAAYLFALAPAPADAPAVAKRSATFRNLPGPTSLQRMLPTATGRYRSQPTDSALSPDGSQLAILTYGGVYLYNRQPTDDWRKVVARPPRVLAPHGLGQAEALCFSPTGEHLYVTGEQGKPVLVIYKP